MFDQKNYFFQEKTYETIFYAGEMLETNFQPAPLPASPTHQIGGVGIVNFFQSCKEKIMHSGLTRITGVTK